MDTTSAEASSDGASRLIRACLGHRPTRDGETEIREALETNIDWTTFAEKITAEQAEIPVAQRLLAAAPDLLPQDLRAALAQIIERAERDNDAILDDIRRSSGKVAQGTQRAVQRALTIARKALRENPADGAAWGKLATFLIESRLFKEAIICCDRAIALAPFDATSWLARARAMSGLGRRPDSLRYIEKALELNPADARAWTRRAYALADLQRFPEALEASDRALALQPDSIAAMRMGIHAALFVCDWRRLPDVERWIERGFKMRKPVITPFLHLAMSGSEARNFELARIWAETTPFAESPLWQGERYGHDRIRIAYISTDFRDVLSVNAVAGCYEEHDGTRFETTAISLNPSDGSETRRRIEKAFDRFIEAKKMSNAEIARKLRELEIDIAIDLNGHAGEKRTGIFAARPAPMQVNYLGYAGTMALPFYDYIIADRIVIPEENRQFYSEKVVYLPHSFFPLDRKRRIGKMPGRAEAGLPQSGFVFACHNTAYKIGPQIFDSWMRLVREIEGSVLWLGSTLPDAADNLRREAQERGVSADRIIFAPKLPERSDHLARLQLADLFLDTMPYNAHTTGCDALWAGVPVVTCIGETFPARVAASLLCAAGVSELMTNSLADYEELALRLARKPGELRAIRTKLEQNRDTAPLFDTIGFTRSLEMAYLEMWKRFQSQLPPASFLVPN